MKILFQESRVMQSSGRPTRAVNKPTPSVAHHPSPFSQIPFLPCLKHIHLPFGCITPLPAEIRESMSHWIELMPRTWLVLCLNGLGTGG